MEDYAKTALSFGSAKEAALYFDYIVPISLPHEILFKKQGPPPVHGDVVTELQYIVALAPEILRENPEYKKQMGFVQSRWVEFALELIDHPDISEMTAADVKSAFARTLSELNEGLRQLIQRFGLTKAPVVVPEGLLMPETAILDESGHDVGDIALTLSELHLIDVSKASWDQVMELKRDPDARQKLLRLRLFGAENYAGKSKSYVEDDLSRRIYDYEQEAKRWGFETTYAALTMLFNSKAIGTVLAGSLLSILFGSNTVAVPVALGAAACVEVGRIGIEVSRRRFIFRNGLQDNPISYIVSAKERFKQT